MPHGRAASPPSRIIRIPPDGEGEMQPSELETRRITIWEQMREIEGELFLLSARSGGLDFENGHRFERLRGERTQLV